MSSERLSESCGRTRHRLTLSCAIRGVIRSREQPILSGNSSHLSVLLSSYAKGDTKMKKLFPLIAAVLLSAVWVFAQDAAPAGSSTSTQATSSGSEMTIEGCLSGSAGNFTLTDNAGKSYQLQGDASKLTDQVGHQVRIKGTQTASASATTPSGGSASAETDQSGSTASSGAANKPSDNAADSSARASAAIQFNVSSVEKLSDSCTASSTNK